MPSDWSASIVSCDRTSSQESNFSNIRDEFEDEATSSLIARTPRGRTVKHERQEKNNSSTENGGCKIISFFLRDGLDSKSVLQRLPPGAAARTNRKHSSPSVSGASCPPIGLHAANHLSPRGMATRKWLNSRQLHDVRCALLRLLWSRRLIIHPQLTASCCVQAPGAGSPSTRPSSV